MDRLENTGLPFIGERRGWRARLIREALTLFYAFADALQSIAYGIIYLLIAVVTLYLVFVQERYSEGFIVLIVLLTAVYWIRRRSKLAEAQP